MNFQSISIPSVIERYNQSLMQVAAEPEKCIQLYEAGAGYLIGELALNQGHAPYRNLNSSPADLDYQLLAKAGLLIASGAKSAGELVLTTGFPYTTYELYKQQAIDFFSPKDIFIEFGSDTNIVNTHKRIQLTIKHLEVMPEILGCITAIRKGLAQEGNFFIVSLGYGTCETALSLETGLVTRTCMSVSGLRYAVNSLHAELSKSHNLGMKNEHMVNQSFQQGKIVIDRKRKDLAEIRRNHLANYYDEVISPTFKKAFTDNDFEKADTLYLVGGGARYADLVECFKQEFDGILNVVIPEQAENMASIGYALRSAQWCGPGHLHQAVGLDIGNAYTVLSRPQVKSELSSPPEIEQPLMLNHS